MSSEFINNSQISHNSLKNKEKKTGRPSTRESRFPIQAEKMRALVRHLIKNGQIATQQELADILDVDNGTISNWVNGQTEMSKLGKYTLAHLYDVPEWWWTQKDVPLEDVIGKSLGQDEHKTDSDSDVPKAPVEWLPLVDDALAADPAGAAITIDTLSLRSSRTLPVLKEYLRGKAERCLLRVKNDSMEPRYYEGDIVMVKLQQRDLKELRGKDVAAWVPDVEAGMLKVLHEHAGRSEWLLTSVNWKYPPVPVPKQQQGFHAFEVERVVFSAPRKAAA